MTTGTRTLARSKPAVTVEMTQGVTVMDMYCFDRSIGSEASRLLFFWGGVMTGTVDFRGENFDGQDLRGRDFSEVDLTGASFRGAKLLNVDFTNAILVGADFTSAEIGDEPYWFSEATKFDGANLKDAKFDLTSLNDVSFLGANLTRATFHGCTNSSTAPRFTGATLTDIKIDRQLWERIENEARERDTIAKLRSAAEEAEKANELARFIDAQETLGFAYLESDLYEKWEYAEYAFACLAERCERELGEKDPRTIRSVCLWATAAAVFGVSTLVYDGRPSDAMRLYIDSIVKSDSLISEKDSSLFAEALTSIAFTLRNEIESELEDEDSSVEVLEDAELLDSIKATIETVTAALKTELALSLLTHDEQVSTLSDVASLQTIVSKTETTQET